MTELPAPRTTDSFMKNALAIFAICIVTLALKVYLKPKKVNFCNAVSNLQSGYFTTDIEAIFPGIYNQKKISDVILGDSICPSACIVANISSNNSDSLTWNKMIANLRKEGQNRISGINGKLEIDAFLYYRSIEGKLVPKLIITTIRGFQMGNSDLPSNVCGLNDLSKSEIHLPCSVDATACKRSK